MISVLQNISNGLLCAEPLLAAEDIDESRYLVMNPDVIRTGLTARDHFNTIGKSEGRLQAANVDAIARLRDQKLARIAWSADLPEGRRFGEPFNFMSSALLEEFGVPESPPVSAHPYPETIAQVIRDNPDKLFLDVGAGLRPTYYANVVNTEIYPSFSTDVLCVGETMPFAGGQFDFVFCFATLEHTKRPWDVAAEICRVLKPGGTVMIDYPFMQPVHGYPHHYFNATPMGNRSLFEQDCDIQSVDIGWHHHPMIGLQWILTVFHRGLAPVDARTFGNLRIADIVDQPLDGLLKAPYSVNLHPDMQRVIASGSLMIATKKLDAPAASGHAGTGQAAGPDVAMQRRLSAQDAKIAQLSLQNAALRKGQESLLESTSWRMTAPLRALAGLVKSSR